MVVRRVRSREFCCESINRNGGGAVGAAPPPNTGMLVSVSQMTIREYHGGERNVKAFLEGVRTMKTDIFDGFKVYHPRPSIRVGTDPTIRVIRSASRLLASVAALLEERGGAE